MPRPRTQTRVTQAVQQVIDARQRTQQAKLVRQDPLDVEAPQRADLIGCGGTTGDSLTNPLFLLGG